MTSSRANRAIGRALSAIGTGEYRLGGTALPDESGRGPWATDCIGFVLWCFGIARHRPGFNVGPWATVSDDVNTDSAFQDARHKQELFYEVAPWGSAFNPTYDYTALRTPAAGPPFVQAGDLVLYPSDRGAAAPVPWGHVALIIGVKPSDGSLTLVQCHGPNGAKMAVQTDDLIFRLHRASLAKHPGSPVVYLRVKV